MFNRQEMEIAVDATKATNDEAFNNFMVKLLKLHPHAVYTPEGEQYIKYLIYDTDNFDAIVGWLLVIYNELIQNRKPTNVATVYNDFYSSKLLNYLKNICLNSTDTSHVKETNGVSDDPLTNIIVLLNIYYRGDKNDN